MAWHRIEPRGENEDDSTTGLRTFSRSVPSSRRGLEGGREGPNYRFGGGAGSRRMLGTSERDRIPSGPGYVAPCPSHLGDGGFHTEARSRNPRPCGSVRSGYRRRSQCSVCRRFVVVQRAPFGNVLSSWWGALVDRESGGTRAGSSLEPSVAVGSLARPKGPRFGSGLRAIDRSAQVARAQRCLFGRSGSALARRYELA